MGGVTSDLIDASVVHSSYGDGGIVRTDLNGYEYAYGLAIQPDGRILVVCQYSPIAFAGDTNLMVLRCLGNGQIDASFGFLGGGMTSSWRAIWAAAATRRFC